MNRGASPPASPSSRCSTPRPRPGAPSEALEVAKKALDSGDAPVPKDVLLVELGRLAEKNGKPSEAKSYYQRVLSDYPDSAMRAEAQQRSQGL